MQAREDGEGQQRRRRTRAAAAAAAEGPGRRAGWHSVEAPGNSRTLSLVLNMAAQLLQRGRTAGNRRLWRSVWVCESLRGCVVRQGVHDRRWESRRLQHGCLLRCCEMRRRRPSNVANPACNHCGSLST